jgi:L-ascorbate metabolism protein UlaG (beta-lactamase superfamily)
MSRSADLSFPVSDHCDGRVFFNPGGVALPRLRAVLRWKCTSRPAHWPRHVDVASQRAAASPSPGVVAVTWINHATFLLQTTQFNLLIDPLFSRCAGPFGRLGPRRVHAPGIRFDALPPIHGVLLSHDHYDHCDLPTLKRLAQRDRPRALTPLGNGDLLARAGFARSTELDWWQSHELLPQLKVTLTPAQHWSNRLSGRRCGRLWGGFFIETEGCKILFVGDTGYHAAHFRAIRDRLGRPDLSLIPIGAYEPRWFMRTQHCNPAEAVQIHRDLESRQSIGMHWGLLPLTDEGRDAPPEALAEALRQAALPPAVFRTVAPGEAVLVGRTQPADA